MPRKYGKKASEKIARVMREFERGTLKSSSGRKVTSREQAIAIGISEARERGYQVPPERHHSTIKKSPAQLQREIDETLARATKGPRRFGGWYVPDVPPGRYAAHHEVEGSFPRTKYQAPRRPDPRRPSLGPGERSASEKQIHPESFAVMNRQGKILGRAHSVKSAMGLAPADKSYAVVRGEFTSEGTNHGVGGGRVMATREFHPSGGFRWYVEDTMSL